MTIENGGKETIPNRPTTATAAAGVDVPVRRPGVPMENHPPHRVGHAHAEVPSQGAPKVEILTHTDRDDLTPVYSNAIPPRLLSGALRRAAYRRPDYTRSHWLMLIVADRIDELEHRWMTPAGVLLAAGALGVLAARAARARRRRTWLGRALH